MGDPLDRRFMDLHVPKAAQADALVVGLPYDGAVLGRRGCRHGPQAIRDALRWFGTDDPRRASLHRSWHDVGDLAVEGPTVLATHQAVEEALAPVFAQRKPVVVLGGDNSLSYPVLAALAREREAPPASVGLVVVDAHYDMRSYQGQPTSGTPFRRVLEELPGRPVQGSNLVEVGIRRHANAASLGAYAAAKGVHVATREDVRAQGPHVVAQDALRRAGAGTQHLWLSIDIDAFDQSIAAGCSAPSPDGLLLHEVLPLVELVARDPRCRGMEIMETAPGFDPSGNTSRTAAALLVRFLASLADPA